MNELTENMLDALIPQCALIAYGNADKINYIEYRSITAGQMGSGIPLTHKALCDILKNINADDTATIPHGRIPDNMLYCDSRPGQERYIWYNPPCKRVMYFTKALNMEDREYYVPGVIYKVEENTLHVYSFKGTIIKENIKIYEAPFFNISGSAVCIGNARENVTKPADLSYDKYLEYWEKIFWQSEFSHLGENRIKGNLVLVTKEAVDKPFNEKVLIPHKKSGQPLTLKDLIK